jgi:hypothetical protein
LIDLIANFDPIAAKKLIASLLEREGFVFSNLLESWGSNSFFVMLEK